MKEYKIYSMHRNDEIIYIGRTTTSLTKRKSCGGYKNIPDFRECEIKLIAVVTDAKLETDYIALYFGMGCALVNERMGNSGLDKKEQKKVYNKTNKEYTREWYQANKQKIAERKKQFYQDNKELITERKRLYQKANREKANGYNKAYRLKKKNNIKQCD